MKAIETILTENRDSVISSIKYIFKVWKNEDVKEKMIEFLSFAKEFANVERLSKSTRVKTDLRMLVQRMANEQTKKRNLEKYGSENPKLAEVISYGVEKGYFAEYDTNTYFGNKNSKNYAG
ncbi:hypothetical protein [Flavobacterium coralii]|uniref:hypothetical protein n=1 Tax=Flavobacterium coralii TaxID=2838017 RepID=UPI000C38A681|nr:hypothetical protein [Flavobacterium sp.]|tara:strand:+ start:11578 stop:11940 length:363 start_codon:yes stop_codon:yes gene_type:complete